SMPGFLAVFGYVDPANPIGYNISTKVQTLLQSLISLGALAACIVIFKFGSFISPRVGLWVASLVGVVSVAAQIGSTNLAALYFGRILLGFSNGFYSTYSAIYIGESAPAYLRGAAIGMVLRDDIAIMKNAWLEETEMRSLTHLLDAFRGADLRRILLSIAAAVSQAATGVYFISAFLVYFFV
ncbi:High-affinity glucose transporter RGT2, partial [Fusarium albosuccineum]